MTLIRTIVGGLLVSAFTQFSASAQDICERFPQGSTVSEPENLYSVDGVLEVNFTYQTREDDYGKILYCFMNSDGAQSPTLHVNPGDTLIINLTNLVPEGTGAMPAMPGMDMSRAGEGGCGDLEMTSSSVNLHYHGTNTPPICYQDEVIRTIINSGTTFRYEVHFPKNEPPGLYWYHPHIHGIATAAVQGGATGALIVEGIENVNPEVAGLPQRVLVIRDQQPVNPPPLQRKNGHQQKHGDEDPDDSEATSDLSVNYIPLGGPEYIPAQFSMKPGERQFWRIVNSCAVSILDLQLLYDGVQQPMKIVAMDGVSLGSQNGSGKGQTITTRDLFIPTAGRAEIIIEGPSSEVQTAQLFAKHVFTGQAGDVDPSRPIFNIVTSEEGAAKKDYTMVPAVSGPPPAKRFPDLAKAKPSITRKLYFSEDDTYFYITVQGQRPKPYDMDAPPAIVTTQGTVEDWTIENRALESHEFHMHQIHFMLMKRDGVTVSPKDQQILDTVHIPYWTGTGPYPNVTVRMDFRGPDVGDFVYHCHILDHEDNGMMAIIRVMPQSKALAPAAKK